MIVSTWTTTVRSPRSTGEPATTFFQVGQIFGADRVVPNVADGDQIATIQTTVGFLSRGVSYATTILGGTGDDVFTVYSNQAPLKLFGEEGNDNFTVRAFVIKGTNQVASSDPLVSGGGGDDHIEYNINAPGSTSTAARGSTRSPCSVRR